MLVFALHMNRMDFHFDLKTMALFCNRVGVIKKYTLVIMKISDNCHRQSGSRGRLFSGSHL
jgi:hypothetical protein